MLSCKDISHLVSESEDRALTRWENLGVALHLLICRNCRRFSRQMNVLRQALRHFDTGMEKLQDDTDALSAEAKDRIQQALQCRRRDHPG